jgi:thiol-disulfide isomerase/thioredoxin
MAGVRPVAVVAAACAAMALAGCGERTQSADPGAGQPPSSAVVRHSLTASASASLPPPTAVKVPEQLRFTAKTVDGKDFSGKSLAGKPAVLWFWAPWCPKCQGEAEDIAAAAKETAGSVSFLGVAAQDQVPAMQDFVQRFGLGSFPHLADTDAAVWKRFGVTYQPAYAFIKADGSIDLVTKQLGTDDLRNRVRALAG